MCAYTHTHTFTYTHLYIATSRPRNFGQFLETGAIFSHNFPELLQHIHYYDYSPYRVCGKISTDLHTRNVIHSNSDGRHHTCLAHLSRLGLLCYDNIHCGVT